MTMPYEYTRRTGRNLPLSNKLVVASRDLSTLADVSVFCAPPFFPHVRPSHKLYWEPLGDQAKPLFARWKCNGREIRYPAPESRITPYAVFTRSKWADTSSWWHPEGLLLDSVCFCPTGYHGYLLRYTMTNMASTPMEVEIVMGGSHRKADSGAFSSSGMLSRFSRSSIALAAPPFTFHQASFDEARRCGVSLQADSRVESDHACYLAEARLAVPARGARTVTVAELMDPDGGSSGDLLETLHRLLEDIDARLQETRLAWERELGGAPKLECPDERVRTMWDWAWVNLEILSRENANCPWLPGVEYTTLLALPLIYCWDHLYTTMVQSFHKPGASRNVLLEFLRHQADDGFIPGEIDSAGVHGHLFTQCHALYAVAAWNYLCASADRAFLEERANGKSVYERLVLAFEWYRRGGQCITCFEHGTILGEFKTPVINFHHEEDGLLWTTGFGDSGWDTADYRGYDNEWVDLNTYLYQGLRAMQEIAGLKGDEPRRAAYAAWADKVKASINQLMWDDADRFYYDLDPGHRRMREITAGGLVPLITDIPDHEKVESIVSRLLDPRHFWRPFGVPCLSASHPRYNPRQYFWLGSCPPQIQNTLIMGLYDHGRPEVGFALWQKLLTAYHKSDGGPRFFCETYDPDSGEGQWSENYNWTSMMVLPLLFGIAGLRVTPRQMSFAPRLPPGWSSLKLEGIWIHGKRRDVDLTPDGAVVKPSEA